MAPVNAMAGADAAATGAEPVEKPITDHREYRPFTLTNGMQVLVISDSKCDKAAAALSVKTGSIFDPKEVQGLAHFLEHMLFLGTEKYPGEDEYNSFLAKHGGMSNAYTADTVTNYYFGVSPDHLEGALDRFSQFFLQPLFTESATDRELKAVDSEHSKNQQSDMWRWNQLLKSDANPKHPLNHFGTGNSETLKTIPEQEGFPVRQRLLEFHKAYYSANLMCLAVLGKDALDDLESLVRRQFGAVVNTGAAVPCGREIGGDEPAFLKDDWPRIVRVIPVRDARTIKFQFILPQQNPYRWRTKPTRYISFCLGHEGGGSVLSALKVRGLATDLMAGAMMDDAGACLFEVGLNLTEAGEADIKRVGEHVFAYIRLLQQLPVSEELFTETQRIEEMNFRFRGLSNPIGAVSGLSHAMQNGLPIDKVLSGPAKVWELNKDEIAEVANLLTCSNLRVLLVSKAFIEAGCCADTDKWYGTKYSTGPLDRELHEAWEAKRGGEGDAAAAEVAAAEMGLRLPRPNPFVAEDLCLKPRPSDAIHRHPVRINAFSAETDAALVAAAPAGSTAGGVVQMYFRQDDKFDLPKAFLNIEIYCPWAAESVENRVATDAWCAAVSEELNELAYDADVAGLSYLLRGGSRGMSLMFGGYQDKLPVLLRTIAEKMASYDEVTAHTFSLVHTVHLRNARSVAKTSQPHAQAAQFEARALMKSSCTGAELLEKVEALTREKLSGVNRKLLDSCYTELLLQGNYAESEVADVLNALLPALRPAKILSALPAQAVGRLRGGPRSCVLLRQEGTNPDEKNSAVIVTLQAAEESLPNITLAELAAQVLSQRCFDELRTKQQLGYIVQCSAFSNSFGAGFCGLKVIVQSEKHPAEVHRRIDTWLAAALAGLVDEAESSNEKLQEYVESLLARKREKPKKLQEEFGMNWGEVQRRFFRFTRQEEVIAFLERPHGDLLPEFRAFVRDRLILAPRFAVEILGGTAKNACAEASAEGGSSPDVAHYECEGLERLESIEDIDRFKEHLVWCESNVAIDAGA